MKTKTTYAITFIVGAVVGSVVTWRSLKKKYEQQLEDQIDSIKDDFTAALVGYKKHDDETDKKPSSLITHTHTDEPYNTQGVFVAADSVDEVIENRKIMHDIIDSNGYRGHSVENYETEENDDMFEPYVIPPEEYGEYMDYEQIELTYFNDGVLADDCNVRVSDIAGTVGEFFADHFGEYEDDSVYVRNDERRCEYEILADERNYADVVADEGSGGVDEDDYL